MKPCIRNLPKFKKGCPENSECPAWITTLGALRPRAINKCADLVMVDLLWDLNCNTIGVQSATESLRNGLCEVDPETNQTAPKAIKMTLVKGFTEKGRRMIGD